VKITLELAPSKDFFSKLIDDGHLQKIRVATTKEMANWMFETLKFKTRVEAFKRSSGKLQQRWTMGVNQHVGWVTNKTPHLGFLNNGTGIYGPRKERIVMRWLIGKVVPIPVAPGKIRPGEAYVVGDNGEALIFRRCTQEAINRGGWTHDGLKPMQFMEKTFEDFEKQKLEEILEHYVIRLFS
jgi:hypothetical protein